MIDTECILLSGFTHFQQHQSKTQIKAKDAIWKIIFGCVKLRVLDETKGKTKSYKLSNQKCYSCGPVNSVTYDPGERSIYFSPCGEN